jgi:hypothetical protein
MSDRELSTRDLAARSDTDESDVDQSESSVERDTSAELVDGDEARAETPATDEATRQDADPVDSTNDGEPAQQTVAADDHEPLLPDDQSERFTTRWQEIQVSFVDEPRDSVAQADALVADLMQRLAASFSNERERLEGQWDRGDDVSTEELRVALTRYRSFFDRLLSA